MNTEAGRAYRLTGKLVADGLPATVTVEDERIAELRERYAGSQKDRADRESGKAGDETGSGAPAGTPAPSPARPRLFNA